MPTSGSVSRRRLLKLGATAATGAMVIPWVRTAHAMAADQADADSCRNIIFMVADGMSPGVPALTDAFSQVVRARGTTWRQLSTDEATGIGFFDMASLNSLVTDSAAASSSWGSGVRICNWALNTLPDGRPLKPIAHLAHESGRAVGLVTTTRITHATPAGFAAVCPNRDLENDIAPQYLDVVDVLLGGGSIHFDPKARPDHRDLRAEYRSRGYALCVTRDELANLPSTSRVLGLFDADHLPYTIDRNREKAIQARVPTLAEMTRSALEVLARSPGGFLLQVEGGRVDHAAHNNDAASLLWDQLAFDDAVAIALEFLKDHPDTLLVITSDHGNSNPGLNGMGGHYQRSTACFAETAKSTASFDTLLARWDAQARAHGGDLSEDQVIAIVKERAGLDISFEDAASLLGKAAGGLNHQFAGRAGKLGQILANQNGIGWTGMAHTSDWTNILARGPGSARFSGVRKNTEAFSIMTALLGIDFRNPGMTADDAARLNDRHPPVPAASDMINGR